MGRPKKIVAENEEGFATKQELKDISKSVDSLTESVSALVDMMKFSSSQSKEANVDEDLVDVVMEKEIKKASPDNGPINPEWEEKAQEIVGQALDHCEVKYLREGGLVFTLVIKKEFSNAPEAYFDLYKSDRRSKEIGNEGIEGVEQWCRLVRQNLNRKKL